MKPSARRVYTALERAGAAGLTTHDLVAPNLGGVRFSARIHELSELGCEIETRRESQTSFRYILRSGLPAEVGAADDDEDSGADPGGTSYPSGADQRDSATPPGSHTPPAPAGAPSLFGEVPT